MSIILFQNSHQAATVVHHPTPSLSPVLQEFIHQSEQLIESHHRKKGVPGIAVAIVKDGHILMQQGFGVKKAGEKNLVDEHTVFRLGSVSKSMASFLTGIAVEEEKLHWDDKVVDYLPNFQLKDPQQTRRVNIGHVLSHTTGLPYHTYTNLVEYGKSLDHIMAEFPKVGLIAKEGEIYAYQNAVFSVIDPILKESNGLSYQELMSEKVFKPLGMRDASLSADIMDAQPNKARAHFSSKRGFKSVRYNKKYYNAAPAGGVNASISDMARWLQALLGHRTDVISKKTLAALYTPRVKTPVKRKYFRHWDGVTQTYYGLGWRIADRINGEQIICHGGYVNGFRAEIALSKDKDLGICILTNAPSRLASELIPDLFELYEAVNQKPAPELLSRQ